MSEERDYARPRLKTVHEAMEEIFNLFIEHSFCDDNWNSQFKVKLRENIDEILDKHDINYNNKTRWNVKDE